MKKISLNGITTIIFDMDGVITNTMPDHFRAWREVLMKEGIPVTHYDIYSREGQPGIKSVEELFGAYHHRFTLSNGRAILRRKEHLFKGIVKQRFVPGARRFLKNLKRKGFQLALVTGTSRHELHRILPDQLYQLFDAVVTGNDVRHGKPHPEPYRLALKKLKIKSREAMVIENAPFGIRSAKSAGIRCLALATSLPAQHLRQADAVFSSIHELRDTINFKF